MPNGPADSLFHIVSLKSVDPEASLPSNRPFPVLAHASIFFSLQHFRSIYYAASENSSFMSPLDQVLAAAMVAWGAR